MKIIADENIPFVSELFSPFGEIVLRHGREISCADVKDADILLVRSVTKVNKALLEGSAVSFVGTCTIGIDHLDTQYLKQQNIHYTSAPGCNAYGVVQYVFSALATLGLLDDINRSKVAVVGCGNVGGTVLRMLNTLGFDCIAIDPFIDPASVAPVPVKPFEAVYDCDLICMHTPLTVSGTAPSKHLFNRDVFHKLKKGAVLLNAGRGGVIHNDALLEYLVVNKDLSVVLDVWEPEPDISTELLNQVTLGSPHIAGYSYEGRVNGSLIIHDKLQSYLNAHGADASSNRAPIDALIAQGKQTLEVDSLAQAIMSTYQLSSDDKALREAAKNLPKSFDLLRKNYPKRREFSHFYARPSMAAKNPQQLAHNLETLGFLVPKKNA